MAKNDTEEGLEGTARMEAFSDGVVAIIVTILILEIQVPQIHDLTNIGVWHAIVPILPKLASFLVSFVTVAIFWVNHHYFFKAVAKSDAPLLWHNNHLLFWLAVVPFVTAFLGDYPTAPLVVAMYGFVLCMSAFAFSLMGRHVLFSKSLLAIDIPMPVRILQYRRTWFGVGLYGASVLLAFVHPYLSLAIFIIVPVYYFLPKGIQANDKWTK